MTEGQRIAEMAAKCWQDSNTWTPEELADEIDTVIKKKDDALLLAARWFKLYQEDKTRYEHPASDADLLGMFDAMQEARLQSTDR